MSISETNKAQKYAAIAEVAAAQAKLSADKLENAPDYAAQAEAAAIAAENSAQTASETVTVVSGIAAQANQSAISAAESAAEAGSAASSAIGRTIRVPNGETLSDLPSSSSRVNTVPVFDVNSNIAVKNLSDFAIIDSGTGKLPVSIIPSVALTVPFVVSSQAQMLALDAQVGDVAKRTDLGYSFMLGADPASTLSNWVQLTDNVLAQLSQTSGAGMIGALSPTSTASTVQQQLDAKASSASLSANTGATTIGATNLAGIGVTVQQSLTSLNQSIASLTATNGFNLVGRFLNLADLKSTAPSSSGQIVYVASAASATATEKHYGGGYFQSFDNSVSPLTDDGGVVIVPTTGALAWRRINFTLYDMCFWGVKPDGTTDNATAITKATQYAKANHVELIFPAGNVKSSQAFPFYSRMSVRGAGRESSFFSKTTNNAFTISTGVTADALLVLLPDVYNPTGTTMDTFCFKPKLEGITFQRDAVTASNMCYYSVWAEKLAAPIMRDLNFIGHYIGIYGKNWFLFEATSVQFIGIDGRTYEGVSCSNASGSTYSLSGTSLNWNLVSVVNAQNGFDIAGQQYSTLTNCTAENIKVIPGETLATAFRFTNPTCITLTSCGTEAVQGEQFRVEMKPSPSFKGSIVISNFQTVDQINPTTATKLFTIDSGGAGTLSVSLIGGELTRNTSLTNLQQPTLSGTNCVLSNVGCWVESPVVSSGAVYKTL